MGDGGLPFLFILYCRMDGRFVFPYFAFQSDKPSAIADYNIGDPCRAVHPAVFFPEKQVRDSLEVVADFLYQFAFFHLLYLSCHSRLSCHLYFFTRMTVISLFVFMFLARFDHVSCDGKWRIVSVVTVVTGVTVCFYVFCSKSFTLRSISFDKTLRNTHTTSAKDEHKTAANVETKQPQIQPKLGTNTAKTGDMSRR